MSQTNDKCLMQLRYKLQGRRVFAVCGPGVWNSLPPSLHAMTSHSALCDSLKTHFYDLAFYHYFIDYVMHARSILSYERAL